MPKRKIVVSERDNIATLFEEDKAVEFIIHRGDMLLGDVYLAAVENVLPSIDAGFVNVGSDKMGFLHNSDVQGKGDLRDRLKPKQRLVVQVMKEPTGHKGPRVTTNISLPGRFLVMMPESRGISISRRIESSQERNRLKALVSLVKPSGVGIIIRTEAEGQREADLKEDFETLMERWQTIVSLADTASPPMLLYRDQDLLYRVIRENVTEDVEEIVVDTPFGFQRAQQLIQNWRLEKHIKLTHYQGNQSIMVGMGVEREIRQALQTKVPLPSGGYLYIQPTEALCVIDVNSGKFTSLASQAETIRITNLEATREIARQLRLRNVGGMVIVDFIDMESRADQLAILESFEKELSADKAKPQLGQLTDLGLVEMTRHRQGQSLMEIFAKQCIACNGSGHSLEEFNWAPPGIDDPRASDRGSWRSRLPLKQLKTTPANASAQSGLSAANLLATQSGSPQGASRGGSRAGGANNGQSAGGGRANMHQGGHGQRSEARSATPHVEEPSLEEQILEKIRERFKLSFALSTKLAVTPPEPNAILSRINPKAIDIFTLVELIEGHSGLPAGFGELDDEQDDDEASDEAEKLASEDAPASPSTTPRRGEHQRAEHSAAQGSRAERQPRGQQQGRGAQKPSSRPFAPVPGQSGDPLPLVASSEAGVTASRTAPPLLGGLPFGFTPPLDEALSLPSMSLALTATLSSPDLELLPTPLLPSSGADDIVPAAARRRSVEQSEAVAAPTEGDVAASEAFAADDALDGDDDGDEFDESGVDEGMSSSEASTAASGDAQGVVAKPRRSRRRRGRSSRRGSGASGGGGASRPSGGATPPTA
ncbi:MAG: Rne/Rng family ribonuclease [Vampirovibrionales bacterium]|nr:Rne/Rng family ribonuclease [Vampirovibrionales bacterium]